MAAQATGRFLGLGPRTMPFDRLKRRHRRAVVVGAKPGDNRMGRASICLVGRCRLAVYGSGWKALPLTRKRLRNTLGTGKGSGGVRQ